jgi:hypothetical protein
MSMDPVTAHASPSRAIRDLSPAIALKRKFLMVYLTVSPTCPDKKSSNVRRLYVAETIEWE